MVSGIHSETRRLCQNNRFPTAQDLQFMKFYGLLFIEHSFTCFLPKMLPQHLQVGKEGGTL